MKMQAAEIISIGVQAISRHRPYFVSQVESWLHFLKSLRPARWGPSPPLHEAGERSAVGSLSPRPSGKKIPPAVKSAISDGLSRLFLSSIAHPLGGA
jgi:hypothetical protein